MANISNINNFFVVNTAQKIAAIGADLANNNGTPYVGVDFTVVGANSSSPVANLWLSNFTHKSYVLISDNSSNFIIRDPGADSNRLTIASGGNATFAAKVFSTSTVSGDIGTTLVTKDYVDSGDGSSINTILITVAAVGGGNRYFLDGVQQANAVLQPGFTYRFDQSNATNNGHPLRFSTNNNNSPAAPYTTGVTAVGTPGSSGAYTQIITTQATPVTLYYYCTFHSGMGGAATIRIIQTDGNATFANKVGIGTALPDNILTLQAAAGSMHQRFKEVSTTIGFIGGANGIISGHNGKLALRAEAGLVLSSQGNSADVVISSGNSTFAGNVGINGLINSDYDVDADNLVLGATSGNTGITIASGSSAGNYGSIYFADGTTATANKAGYIRYEQNTSKMTIGINAVEKIAIALNGDTTFAGSIDVGTGNSVINGDLYFGVNADIFKSSGDFKIDVAGDISLDAGGNDIRFKVANVEFGKIKSDSGNLAIFSSIQDEDILFKGNDGGSVITALTLDMSNGGSATFRDDIDFGGKLTQTGTGANTFAGDVKLGDDKRLILGASTDGTIQYDGTNDELEIKTAADASEISLIAGTTNTYTSEIQIGARSSSQGEGIFFKTRSVEKMRITSAGDVLIGGTSFVADSITIGQNGLVRNSRSGTGTNSHYDFLNDNGVVGSITTNGSATAFNASSDYRLKENVVEMTGALERVSQLKPSRFNFIADADKTVDGFLAHEVQEIVPEAITGEKDAVDDEGNPEYQGIDQSKLVPLLVGAIKELKAEIEILKNK